MSFLRWISRWPLWLLDPLGAALGWLVWAMSPTYRRRLAANAGIAGVPAAARRESVAAAGRMVAETMWLWMRPADEPLGAYAQWQPGPALDELDALVAAGRSILLLTPHMGSFEVTARAWVERYGERAPLTVLYRPSRNAWLRGLQETARARPHLSTAPATLAGVRQMLRALRRGETVGLLPDQVPPEGQGVWAPFFGLPAYTMTLAARLAQQTGAEPVILRGERLPRGRGWRVHNSRLAAPLPAGSPDTGLEAAATLINQSMEATILTQPGQYLWAYNRYKQPRPQAAAPAGEDAR